MAAPGNTILLTYPEENPLEANPPWPSIFLDLEVPAELQKLNKDDISQALEEGRITGVNPLGNLYGNNPFEVTDKDLVVNALPIKHYTPPPMLPEIAVSNLEFLEKLNPHGHTPIDKVTMGETGEVYALKMVSSIDLFSFAMYSWADVW